MFNMNNRPIVAVIVSPIQIKHVHSSVSYQWAIYQEYNRRCHESPSGYGPLEAIITIVTIVWHTLYLRCCIFNGLLAMNYLRWQLEIIGPSCCMSFHWKAYGILQITV